MVGRSPTQPTYFNFAAEETFLEHQIIGSQDWTVTLRCLMLWLPMEKNAVVMLLLMAADWRQAQSICRRCLLPVLLLSVQISRGHRYVLVTDEVLLLVGREHPRIHLLSAYSANT